MDKLAERIASILGSAYVIVGFGLWMIYHNFPPNFHYVNFISDVAIEIGLLILRAENVQSERTEKAVKDDVRLSRKILKKIK